MRTGILAIASVTRVSKPTLLQSRSPTTQMIHMSLSTVTVPYFFSSSIIFVRFEVLSIVTLTPTSEVVIMSIGVLYDSNISNTLRRKPVASSIRLDFIFIAVILSFAATAFIFPRTSTLSTTVPSASGSIVFLMRTGTPAYLAG